MKKLFKLALFGAIVAAVVKTVAAKKAEWQGLTESQVREKLTSKLGDKMPGEKVEELGDKIVGAMRERGVLSEEVAQADEVAPAEETSTAAE